MASASRIQMKVAGCTRQCSGMIKIVEELFQVFSVHGLSGLNLKLNCDWRRWTIKHGVVSAELCCDSWGHHLNFGEMRLTASQHRYEQALFNFCFGAVHTAIQSHDLTLELDGLSFQTILLFLMKKVTRISTESPPSLLWTALRI